MVIPKIVLLMDNPVVPTGYASTCRLTAKELTKRGWEVYATAFNGGQQGGHDGGISMFAVIHARLIAGDHRRRHLFGQRVFQKQPVPQQRLLNHGCRFGIVGVGRIALEVFLDRAVLVGVVFAADIIQPIRKIDKPAQFLAVEQILYVQKIHGPTISPACALSI